jgi:hypothetical protein
VSLSYQYTQQKTLVKPFCSYRWYQLAREIAGEAWSACFPKTVEGSWWYETLESCGLEKQFQFQYLVIFDENGPAAIAPVFLMNVPLQVMAPAELKKTLDLIAKFAPFLTNIRTLFIGSPCAEEGTVGIAAGRDPDFILAKVNEATEELAAEKSASMIVWKDFEEGASDRIARQASGWGFLQIPSFPGTELTIPLGDFETYLQSLKKTRRQNIKKKLASSRTTGSLTAEVISRPDDNLISQLFALFWQTYQKSETKFEVLTLDFFRKIAVKEPAHFLVLRDENGTPVAFRLFFELESKIISKFIGIDYQRESELFLLFRLVEEGIRYAQSKGMTIIQSGQTAYGPKLEMGHRLVPQYNFMRHRNPLIHKILVHLASDITWSTVDESLATYLKAHPDALPKHVSRSPKGR